MRVITLLVVALLSCCSLLHAQWKPITVPQYDATAYGMTMTDSLNLYVAAWGGKILSNGSVILRSTNGGLTWDKTARKEPFIFGVGFSSRDTGVVTGYDSACNCASMIRTTDAGSTWNAQTLASSFGCYVATFPTRTTGFACGYGGAIYKSTDAGASWMLQSTGTSDVFRAMNFFNDQVGYAVAGYGQDFSRPTEIFSTTDGGTHWTLVKDFKNVILVADVAFTSPTVGCFAGINGATQTIMRTSDGGANWETVWSGGPGVMQALYIRGAKGVAVGDSGVVLRTYDSGATWHDVSPAGSIAFDAVCGAEGRTLIGGVSGMLLMSTSSSSSVSSAMPIADATVVYPNPALEKSFETIALSPTTHGDLRVYDALGRIVFAARNATGDVRVPMPDANGTFNYQLVCDGRIVAHGRFVVQK